MPRRRRIVGESGWAHIILRGINRESLFYDKADNLRFISTFKRFQKECNIEMIIMCLMTNHVHILMKSENGEFAEFIKKVSVSYAAFYNKKYDRVGYVFQDRFRSAPVENERYLFNVMRYIYQNPQKSGICQASDYPYTILQMNELLSDYFDSQSAFFEFMNAENDDVFMEYDSLYGKDDERALIRLLHLTQSDNPQEIQTFVKAKRDNVLKVLKDEGFSVRQLSRLTGINRNIVQRA